MVNYRTVLLENEGFKSYVFELLLEDIAQCTLLGFGEAAHTRKISDFSNNGKLKNESVYAQLIC